MAVLRSLPRPLLVLAAALFAAVSLLYGGLWVAYENRRIPVELGFDNRYIQLDHCELVQSVVPGSPAERAGMRRGDRINRINGSPLEDERSLTLVWAQHKPGDAVELTIQRPGIPDPLLLRGTFRANSASTAEGGVARHVGDNITRLLPVPFLTVGLAVLFLRLEDPNAWLLALLFGGFLAIPGLPAWFLNLPGPLRLPALAYRVVLNNIVAALFYLFFATFPTPSPLDRRVPRLKWFALAIGACQAVLALLFGAAGPGANLGWLATGLGRLAILVFNYGFITLGFVALIWNSWSARSSEARRKIRVILWGALIGVVPAIVALAASDFFAFRITIWLSGLLVLLLWLFPLSFAYAVVKHRVLEIPVLLRRSARYLLVQRGFVILLVLLSVAVTSAFALLFARRLQSLSEAAAAGGIALGTVFGTVLLWSGARVHRKVGKRIDRAFFRNSYDARIILEDLLEKARVATDRLELAALLERQIKEALEPSSLSIYFEAGEALLMALAGPVPPELKTVSAVSPEFDTLARRGRPWEVSANGGGELPAPLSFSRLRPDCLVPILGRDNRLAGLVVLGPRLSEEPYSSEDQHLLASVAVQAGIALESICLGEKVAERIEAERRAAQEMEFARQVQSRLFPQKLPAMKTLEYAGACLAARTVGGDYYDFLELRPGRLALVVADIAGKGVPAALLMANLQANLRSQYALAVDDLPRLLASVNRLFYENTDVASYATLFFADYDDTTRRLRYANCGHLPALLLRAGATSPERSQSAGSEWLRATGTVLGLFENWRCGGSGPRCRRHAGALHRWNHRSRCWQ
jgi:sigma-B regulation protein RsbU (phosphoserine phosphatase)